jgi:hypothetical protein
MDMESDFDCAQRANIVEFGRLLNSLLESALGKFVLVKDAHLVDTFSTREAALRFGYTHYGRSPFLVQPVAPLPDRAIDFRPAWRA